MVSAFTDDPADGRIIKAQVLGCKRLGRTVECDRPGARSRAGLRPAGIVIKIICTAIVGTAGARVQPAAIIRPYIVAGIRVV